MTQHLNDPFKLFSSLQVERQVPSLDFLNKLVLSHLERIPFESASKILHADKTDLRLVSLAEYVNDIFQCGLGGTCFANNAYFVEMLNYLGFHAELVSVNSGGSESSHVSCRVNWDGQMYFVDLGNMTHFAGPFPLIKGNELASERGNNRVVFTPNDDGLTYHLEFYRDGKLIRHHVSRPESCEISDLNVQIQATLKPDAYWMQTLCVCKHTGEETLGLWNKTFYKQFGTCVEKREINDLSELRNVLSQDLKLPNFPVAEVLAKLKTYSGVSLFTA